METIQNVLETILNNVDLSENDLGIRTLSADENYTIGDSLRNSFDYDSNKNKSSFYTNKKELEGSCVTSVDFDIDTEDEEYLIQSLKNGLIESLEYNKENYFIEGMKQVVVAGYKVRNGMDYKEWILADTEIICYL